MFKVVFFLVALVGAAIMIYGAYHITLFFTNGNTNDLAQGVFCAAVGLYIFYRNARSL